MSSSYQLRPLDETSYNNRKAFTTNPLRNPSSIPGSQYKSTAAAHGINNPWTGGSAGAKLYPFTETNVLGLPLYARTTGSLNNYTPP